MRALGLRGLAVGGLGTLVPAADPPKPPEQPVHFDKRIDNAPLADVLEYVNDRFDLAVRVDEAAFKKAGRERVPEKAVSLPRMAGVPVAFALEVAAQQA